MDTQSTLQPLPRGFHWEAQGPATARHLVVVPDINPDVWLATIGDQDNGCLATIRRHQARAAHIDRPFRTAAAASGWVARWLDRQGRLIAAELAGQ
ncbi:hypothetical protein [Lysobacter gummosus]|uniref:Uncharacterized protein n=1 Tax=Lysobacter gummosus TaxID=262324 RepID=A0ABY3XER1_9GAMM|nr:hypothetical protein [Lysobacter gummosus]UNP29288.1 hypothetical protein MOV92_22925 [Lysobacter gummosus]